MIKINRDEFIKFCFNKWRGKLKISLLSQQETDGICIVLCMFEMFLNENDLVLKNEFYNKILYFFVNCYNKTILYPLRLIRKFYKNKNLKLYECIKKIELKMEILLICAIVWYVNITKICIKNN